MNNPEEIMENDQSNGDNQKESTPLLLIIIMWLIFIVCNLSLPFSEINYQGSLQSPEHYYKSYLWLWYLPGFIIPLVCLTGAYLFRRKYPKHDYVILFWIWMIHNSLYLVLAFLRIVSDEFSLLDSGSHSIFLLWAFMPPVVIALAVIVALVFLYMKIHRQYYMAVFQSLIPMFIVWYWIVMLVPLSFGARRGAYEIRCVKTLEFLAQAQHDYADTNEQRFGTYHDLLNKEYIMPGYTRTNIIDNYSLAVFKVAIPEISPDVTYKPSFSIVAVPRSVKNRLRTFGICEDQHPRVWIGDTSSFDLNLLDMQNDNLWKPIR